MTIEELARQFIAAVNQHDVDAICAFMTEDHTFIDSGGERYQGLEKMRRAWSDYFKMFPDYKIEAPEFIVSDDTIVLLGKASGTYSTGAALHQENHWEIPAAWKAVMADGQIKLWQVFADNTSVAEIIRKQNH